MSSIDVALANVTIYCVTVVRETMFDADRSFATTH